MTAVLVALSIEPLNAQSLSPSAEVALREIDRWTMMQARSDPHFLEAEKAALQKVGEIVESTPPERWLPVIRRTYLAASEAAHRKERDAISVVENVAFVRPRSTASSDEIWGLYEARLRELAQQLESGRIGPRQQALHAVEAARLYYPGDQSFLSYREARVSLATAYEMGLMSRHEFDERWRREGEAFAARERERDRFMADLQARYASDAARLEMESIRLFQPRLPVTCSSRIVPGVGLQTTCR